jgi:hypothetical protein
MKKMSECKHTKIVCPEHEGGFDCTPFCSLCEGDQEFCPSCENVSNEQWEKIYKPITNLITNEGLSFETYGEELDYVASHDTRNVWTEMDGDNGVYIVNGFHYVNRIQYYVTEEAWNEGDDITITVCEYVTCSCYNEETQEGNPDCDECNGDGNYTDWKF